MGKYKDLTGNKYGKLTVLRKTNDMNYKYKIPQHEWECICDCGNKVIVVGRMLREGHKTSCGCLTHKSNNMSNTRIYRIWFGMKERCDRESNSRYKYYGQQNISYCDEWKDFNKFYEDMGEEYQDNLTLDRIDFTKGYTKDNCRWITQKEQVRNRSITKKVEYNGKLISLGELSEEFNINYNTLYHRVFKHKWDIERALTKAV